MYRKAGTGQTKREAVEGSEMLDWLKSIIGDNYTEDIDKQASEHIGKNFVSTTNYNTLNEAKKGLDEQIKDRDKQLEDLKKVDAKGLQEEIVKLQGENKTAKETYDSQVAKLKRDSALDMALITGKARDSKAVRALLNMEEIKLDGDKLIGLDGQLESLKKDKDYLFEIQSEDPNKSKVTVSSGGEHGGGITDIDKFAASARAAAGLPTGKE